jgi:predicted Zn-dependent protease
MTLSRADAKRIVDRALNEASVGDLRVRLRAGRTGNARFGDSMPTTSGDVDTLEISVTATTGDGRHATARGNRTDEPSIAALVRRAEEMARLAPVDPEHPRPLGKQTYARVVELDRKVVAMSSKERATVVGAAIEAGRAADAVVSGYLQHGDGATAHADRSGLFAYHRRTDLSLGVTCRTRDGSGSSKQGFVSHAMAGLDASSLAADAAAWAVRSREPVAMDPGTYTVILTADAVSDLMDFFLSALSHRRASEGRSYFAAPGGGTRIGETLFSPYATLWSDPSDREHPASPISEDGRPQDRVEWVKEGTLRALTSTHAWAEKAGVPSRPRPNNLHMSGGTDDLDALIAGTADLDRAVLVTRFWYNRMLEPRTILATGLTRDGTFLVEKGSIVRPIRNFRYNDSPVTLLRRAITLGKPRRAGLSTHRVYVVPPMVVEGFNFASASDAI